MRTYDELFRSAMSLRYRLLEQQRDPSASVFSLTEEERCILHMQPFNSRTIDHANERFCGFKLYTI